MNTISERIRFQREERGMSQSELARRMSDAGWTTHSQVTISRTEKDERRPRLDEAVALARILGVSIQWLATGDPESDLYADGFNDGITTVRNALEGMGR